MYIVHLLFDVIDNVLFGMVIFSAIFILICGLDDIAVDLTYIIIRLYRIVHRTKPVAFDPSKEPEGRIAIFVPAWDESAVIGAMLQNTLETYRGRDFILYVGVYPNDRDTRREVMRVVAKSSQVRMVVGRRPGPTTKAGCLNTLWHAMRRDERATGVRFLGVALHDAEDVVHPLELHVYTSWLQDHAAVQLPVLPLAHPKSRFISGHYLDEFAEAHGKQMVVRQALGVGLPLAGVGCAIRCDMLQKIAQARGGDPFDPGSLTEDYELGLKIADMGGRMGFARVADEAGGLPISVRAYFPSNLKAAVSQKARWMTGIALAGWDRTGWGKPFALADHWMRMRDRRATLTMPVLAFAYLSLLLWGALFCFYLFGVRAFPDVGALIFSLMLVNVAIFSWRSSVRALFVWRSYNLSEAILSIPRFVVGNVIALLAARRALSLYSGLLGGGRLRWDKTAHEFPDTSV